MTDWPDWRGEIAVIVASGPSARKVDLELLRDCKTIAVKEGISLAYWAHAVYGCDAKWWRHRHGLPFFSGLKIGWTGPTGSVGLTPDEFPDIRRVLFRSSKSERYEKRLLMDHPGEIGTGDASGFQAFNLALQWGARKIILVGFDAARVGASHFYGDKNPWSKGEPNSSSFSLWLQAFQGALPVLQELGATVINCSPFTAMRQFEVMSPEDALERLR